VYLPGREQPRPPDGSARSRETTPDPERVIGSRFEDHPEWISRKRGLRSSASVAYDSPQPSDFSFRRLESSPFIIKDPPGMAADRKPSAIVFEVAPKLLETDSPFWPQKNIDAQ
jgi:hypothetical protein